MADFGKAAKDYARYRQGFPDAFFARLARLGIALPGQAVLDLGTGTGLLARAFAEKGCRVTGLDPSEALLAEARAASAAAGLEIAFLRATAEATGLAPGRFDLVSAATCWHWLDRPAAAREAFRLLKPGGRLLIAHLDWHRTPGNVIDLTLQVIDRHAARGSKGRYSFEYPKWLGELTPAGFAAYEAFGFSCPLAYSHEAWRGRVRASARVGPAMDPETLRRFDAEFEAELRRAFPEDPLSVAHRVFALVLTKPGEQPGGLESA